ncbi:MAG: hypothetical protein KF830_05965 [Planctomycetes bacterium]|nr:hypothetical protein [Planctomycetota bacterium]
MAATSLKTGAGTELKRIAGMLATSIGESLGALVGRELVVRPGEPELHPADAFAGTLPRAVTVSRGALDKAYAGRSLLVLLELVDAVAMAGLLMMTPDDVVQERRRTGSLTDEDAAAFGELGNVMFAAFANVLRENVADCEVGHQGHQVLRPNEDAAATFGTGTLVVVPLRIKLGEYPESRGCLVLDLSTAEAWNKAPLGAAGDGGEARAASGGRSDEETFENIPPAPVRATLAAFVMQPEVLRPLRMSCRRVGLDLRRHGRGEIPNPAAHRNEVVLMDVPAGEDRRFDWCRRIKELSDSTRVVLLVHQPSRHRVMQAFLSRADAILGFPCDEATLSQKLGSILDAMAGEPRLP